MFAETAIQYPFDIRRFVVAFLTDKGVRKFSVVTIILQRAFGNIQQQTYLLTVESFITIYRKTIAKYRQFLRYAANTGYHFGECLLFNQ